jgi:hypothetical protein
VYRSLVFGLELLFVYAQHQEVLLFESRAGSLGKSRVDTSVGGYRLNQSMLLRLMEMCTSLFRYVLMSPDLCWLLSRQ